MIKRVLTISVFASLLCINILAQELPAVFPKYVAKNERIDAFKEKKLVPFQEKLSSLLKSHQNTHAAYQALEKEALSQYEDHTFIVEGKSYTLRRPQGGDLMGKIYSDGDLSFVHYYKELKMVLLRIQYSEGSSFLLVNLETKQEIGLLSPPVFNEDNSRILTYANQGEADYGPHGFRMLQKDDKGNYWQYFTYDTTPLGPIYGEWVNDNTIKMKFVSRWIGTDIGTQYYQIKIEQTH